MARPQALYDQSLLAALITLEGEDQAAAWVKGLAADFAARPKAMTANRLKTLPPAWGRNMAASLGLNHDRIMKIGLTIVALISSITIVGVGNIPFLGLVISNIISIYRGGTKKSWWPIKSYTFQQKKRRQLLSVS